MTFVSNEYRSADELAKRLIATPDLVRRLQDAPTETIRALADEAKASIPRALEQDRTVYRIVVFSLGFTVVVTVVGVLMLAIVAPQAPVPDVLTALGSAAIGALAGLVASPK